MIKHAQEIGIRTAALFGAGGCVVLSGMSEIGARMEGVTKAFVDKPERPPENCYDAWAVACWKRATRAFN